jgi:RimJ/RimL family protein N-acetyltransferase
MLFQFLFTDPAINASIAVQRIVWDTMLENVRAQHVYEKKIGARRVRVVENAWQDQIGNWRNSVEYEIDRNTFFDGSDSPD